MKYQNLLKVAAVGFVFALGITGVTTQVKAATVNPDSTVQKTSSVTEFMKVKTTAKSYKTAAFWNYPYGSNTKAKKTHWVRNYANKALTVTKMATLKNGLKYYYVKVNSKPKVRGWIYSGNLREMSYVALGDSITKGWTGTDYAMTPYPTEVGKALGMTVTNLGENNGQVVGDSKLDLTYNIDHHNFKNDDVVTIAYGVNDYFHTQTVAEVQSTLNKEIKVLRAKYPHLQIFGILPMDCYVKDQASGKYVSASITDYSSHAYNLNDLRDGEQSVYTKDKIQTLDWRNYDGQLLPRYDSRDTAFGDTRLHPTQATYTQMSNIIEYFLGENVE
ncbi:SGNH/GDSL hydrolase family protein [Secundilactobacillus folii]|uniref:GDSL family lipase n=1 Tax=Secundilactobacillus folii TaxID=2678357 RepID=A0A7X2XX82_9LACO|nr:SGNH/GDSL hydrolase family protein [Secundilactobacillus folii]MTV83329.1 GDSL family lipase [Secundilactobacillus folii]